MSRTGRIGAVLGASVILAALALWFVFAFLRSRPATVAAERPSAATASLTLQTVGTIGFGPRPDWVSYLVRQPDGSWTHSTMFALPANSLVHVTVYQFANGPLSDMPEFKAAWGCKDGDPVVRPTALQPRIW